MKQFAKDTLTVIFLFLAFACLLALLKANSIWGDIYIEQLFINLEDAFDSVDRGLIIYYAWGCFLALAISLGLSVVLKARYLWGIGIVIFGFVFYKIGLFSYVMNKNIYTNIYEKEYQDPKKLSYLFPESKRNLILIYLESMEKEYQKLPDTGENLIENISRHMKENLSFEGFHQIARQDYTISAMVESLCGVPYRDTALKNYTEYQNFLEGLVCIPQILKENGYQTYFMKGADVDFARTRLFMQSHGFQNVWGKNEINQKFSYPLKENMGAFSGYRDKILYEVVKDQLSEAKNNQPFFISFITLDMHKPDIYLDPSCQKTNNKRKDVVVCEDEMLESFLNWLQEQDFYENTTVVVVGDHTEAGKNEVYPHLKDRHIVNFVLNPHPSFQQKVYHRFTTLDLAPTFLNVAGIEIKEEGFGLGRSLFSQNPTLFEQMGLKLETELSKSSKVYESFEAIKKVSLPKYEPYHVFGTTLSTFEEVQKYATYASKYTNIAFLDELSFSFEAFKAKAVRLSILFKMIFKENKTQSIRVFVNDKPFNTWSVSIKDKQPVLKSIMIPKEVLEDDRLLVRFEAEDFESYGKQPGIGVVSLNIEALD